MAPKNKRQADKQVKKEEGQRYGKTVGEICRRSTDALKQGFEHHIVAEAEREEEELKASRRGRKAEKRSQKAAGAAGDEEEGGGMDPEMAAMMGFGGFGGSKK